MRSFVNSDPGTSSQCATRSKAEFKLKYLIECCYYTLARDSLPGLVSNLTSNAINKFDRKISEEGAVRAGKGFNLFISNEDMNDIIKIIKSLEDSGVLIDGVTETVKCEMKKQKGGFP